MNNFDKYSFAVSRLPMVGESRFSAIATACCNLRRDAMSDDLRPVGAPNAVAGLPEVPFAVVGKLCFYDRAGMVYMFNSQTSASELLGALPGSFKCAAVVSPTRIEVMTARGHITIAIDSAGHAAFVTSPSHLPHLRFTKVDEHAIGESVSSHSLTGSYDARSGAFNDTDAANLATDLLAAYERLDRTARSAGYNIQPVMLRYKLYGADDELLYTSNPCVIGASDGFQCIRSFSALLDGTRRLASSISARAYKVQLILNDIYTPDETVERLVVEATPAAHPVDYSGSAATRVVSAQEGNNGVQVDFCIPGCSVGMSASPFNGLARLRDMADRQDSAFTPVATLYKPFVVAGRSICVDVPAEDIRKSVKSQLAALAALAAKQPAPLPYPMPLCMPPHRFSASSCATVGTQVVWGNIEVHPFEGYSLEHFAVSRCADEWEGAAIVRMADGTVAVATSHAEIGAPERFSQMLTYPSPQAREITLAIRRNAQCYAATFPLTPSADNSCAYYIADKCIELPEVQSLDIPFDTRVYQKFPEVALTAERRAPTMPGSMLPTQSGITAMAAIDRRGGAWEYAKNRVYIFGEGGTTIANINSAGAWTSAHLFDTRPVKSPRKVCVTTDDRFPVITVAGNDLVGFCNNSLKTLQSGVRDAQIAWDPVDRELWVCNSLGEVEIHTTPGGGRYTLTDWCALAMAGFNNTLFIMDENETIHSTSAGRASEDIEVIYNILIESPDASESSRATVSRKAPAMRRLRGFSVGMQTTAPGRGTVTISTDDEPVCSLEFEGPVERRLAARPVAFPAFSLSFNITATLPPQARIKNVLLRF